MNGKASYHIWRERPVETLRGQITRRNVTSDRMMLGEVRFQKGDRVPPHRHDNEQFTHVLRGCLKFALGEQGEDAVILRAGEVIIIIPPNLLHAVEALEDALEYDMFTPPRQDWIDSESAFLRR